MRYAANAGMVIAQIWDDRDHMGRGWWWVMGIGWLVVLAGIVILAIVVVRHFTQNVPVRGGAEDVVAERFARGEIDEDEYRRRRDALRG